VPRCQKSRRWQYRRKPAHLAERRNPKRCDNIINIAYLSIHNMRIIAQGHESIFSPGLRWAMVFARYPRAYAVAGWQHTQAQGPEVAFRGCNPIGVHRAFGCQSCHPGEAGTSQPTRPFPRGTIKERQVASRASQTLGTRLGGPLSTHERHSPSCQIEPVCNETARSSWLGDSGIDGDGSRRHRRLRGRELVPQFS